MPYLTPAKIEQMGVVGLNGLSQLPGVPLQAQFLLRAMVRLVPLLEDLAPVVELAQHLCDGWNHMFGLSAPA